MSAPIPFSADLASLLAAAFTGDPNAARIAQRALSRRGVVLRRDPDNGLWSGTYSPPGRAAGMVLPFARRD